MVFMRGLCLLTLGKKVSRPLPAFFAFNSAKFLSQLHRAVDNAESHYLQPHYETHSISASSSSLPQLQSSVNTVCSMVLQSYYEQFEKKLSPHRLNLERIDPESLTHDQAITVVASLAKEGGSMAALGFFNWAIGFPKFRYFMRLYIVCAGSLIDNGNLVKAQQVMSYMVLSFSEIGRLSQAVDMIFEMNNQGLPLNGHLVNCVTRVACDMGLVEYAEKVFDDMCARGVSPTSCTCSFKSMVVGYCRLGRVLEASKWLHEMVDRKIVIDNATCSLVINSLCLQDSISKAFWFFNQMIGMGFTPNLINFTALINGLCKKGKIKHAFEVLEEMVRRGWKPNVYTHTAVIDGLCKKGWTEKAFRLFLKLVRSDCYKPNVRTYTAMIYGYCKEGKLNRAEMLYSRMKEQELVPNVNTYTTLISGHCKEGNFSRAYKLMDIMTTEDLTLSISVYNAVSSGLCKKGRISEAFDLLRKGIQRGAEADEITYTILISTSCRQVDTVTSLAYFCKMNKSGIRADIYTYNALLGALCRQKRMEESERLFKEALELDLVPTKETYTSLICGYCRNASICLGLAYFHRMVDHGCQPDSFAYGTLISGLCKESRLEEANQLYKAMVEKGLTPSEVTRLTVAYEYCKRDNSASALSTLEHLERKLWVRTVRTLVRKLCSEGRAEMGVLFFRKLLEKEQNADRVTMAAVLTACYESGKYELVSGLSENIQNGRKNRLLSVAPQPA